MMTNDNSITFPYPPTLQEQYHRLISTRDNFLQKLSTAERLKLITSYELLINTWAQNRTEQQKNTIEELSEKLNLLLEELKNDGMSLKNNIEKEVLQYIESSLTQLTSDENDLNAKKETLTELLKIWKNDILTRNAKLNKRQNELKETSTQRNHWLLEAENQLRIDEENLNSELSAHETEWTNSITENYNQLAASEEQLNELLQAKERLSSDYETLSKKSQDALKDYSQQRQPSLTSLKATRAQLSSKYKQTERTYLNDLEQKRKNWERNLKNYET